MADASHLFTTVKNPLSTSRVYGYLGTHGKTLPGGAHFSFAGHIADQIMSGQPATKKRKLDSLQRDLIAGKIVITQTPRPILKDATTSEIKALDLDTGSLGTVDPSWGAYTDV